MAKNKEIKKETDEMRDAREFAEMYSKLNTADNQKHCEYSGSSGK